MSKPSSFHPTLGLVGAVLLSGLASPDLIGAEETPFQQQRAKMVAKHDRNSDGRLDAAEREHMRLALKQERLQPSSSGGSDVPADVLADYDTNKNGEMEMAEWAGALIAEQAILTRQFDANKDGQLNADEIETMMRFIRTEKVRYARDYFAYMLKYDKNKNGRFDGDEYATAQASESAVVEKAFDANKNGTLDKEELDRLRADLGRGAIPGFYAQFAGAIAQGGRRQGNYLEEQQKVLVFDTDGDGIASAGELQRAREARQFNP